ncbi:MAG: HTTM domain-containing protein [Planctomycetes bacterium]|nr:HTTM domain-containing protein [Planctomycetota bacterium]
MSATASQAKLRRRIERFFFAEEVPFGPALVRIALPLVLLGAMLPRALHVRELYSTDGASTPLWILYGYARLLPVPPAWLAVPLSGLLIFCLIASSLGWCTRFSLAAATALYTWFNLVDAISTMTKYSVIASHVLLLLTLSRCGDVWSLDAWLSRRRSQSPRAATRGLHVRSPVWPRRLLQLLIGCVYFGAAVTKMHTPSYFTGDQLRFWMISDINFGHPVGEYLSAHSALIVAGAYITIVWELLFLFLAWRGIGRFVMLGLGVAFHVMTNLLLGLYIFPLVSLSIYFAFLNEADVRALRIRWRKFQKRYVRRSQRPADVAGSLGDPSLPVAERPAYSQAAPPKALVPAWLTMSSSATFAVAATFVACGFTLFEHRLDPYGLRRAEGAHRLRELDPPLVQAMLAPAKPVRLEDKVFSFDVGTLTVGGSLATRRRQFRAGEEFIAQVMMNPPFEDMWLECNLHDAEDRVLNRIGQPVTRDMMRATFIYTLPHSLEPGEYSLVVATRGREITRRTITVRPSPASRAPLAN